MFEFIRRHWGARPQKGPRPTDLTEEQAVERARALAASRGWPWIEPVEARFVPGAKGAPDAWEVHSNLHGKGSNAEVRLEAETGVILEANFLPR